MMEIYIYIEQKNVIDSVQTKNLSKKIGNDLERDIVPDSGQRIRILYTR